jgi:hypothetical protein
VGEKALDKTKTDAPTTETKSAPAATSASTEAGCSKSNESARPEPTKPVRSQTDMKKKYSVTLGPLSRETRRKGAAT